MDIAWFPHVAWQFQLEAFITNLYLLHAGVHGPDRQEVGSTQRLSSQDQGRKRGLVSDFITMRSGKICTFTLSFHILSFWISLLWRLTVEVVTQGQVLILGVILHVCTSKYETHAQLLLSSAAINVVEWNPCRNCCGQKRPESSTLSWMLWMMYLLLSKLLSFLDLWIAIWSWLIAGPDSCVTGCDHHVRYTEWSGDSVYTDMISYSELCKRRLERREFGQTMKHQ